MDIVESKVPDQVGGARDYGYCGDLSTRSGGWSGRLWILWRVKYQIRWVEREIMDIVESKVPDQVGGARDYGYCGE